jgi:hypothetical protein
MNYVKRVIGSFKMTDFEDVNIENFKVGDLLYTEYGDRTFQVTAIEIIDNLTIVEFTRIGV